jgi:hypothetical protein
VLLSVQDSTATGSAIDTTSAGAMAVQCTALLLTALEDIYALLQRRSTAVTCSQQPLHMLTCCSITSCFSLYRQCHLAKV